MTAQSHSEQLSELLDAITHLRSVLHRQIRLLDHIIFVIIDSKRFVPPDRIKDNFSEEAREVIPLMIQGIGSSCHTLHKLSDGIELQVRDCFPIARSVIEGIINVCFILAEGDSAAKRARDHALQKSYRDLERDMRVENWGIRIAHGGRVNPSAIAGLEDALAEWTTKSGHERSQWTKENIEKRISIIGKRFGLEVERDLLIATFSIYRHASEITHGTFFGSLFFFGATRAGKPSPDEGRVAIGNHLLLILFAVIFANSALVNSFSKAYGTEPVFAEVCNKLVDKLYEIPLFKAMLET